MNMFARWLPVLLILLALILLFSAASFALLLLIYKRGKSGERQTASEGADISAVAEGIRAYAADFDGLYEGLYQSALNLKLFSTDAYEEWCDRVEQTGDDAFKSAFSKVFQKLDTDDEKLCREKFGLLLKCIAAAGITRDGDSGRVRTADGLTSRAYLEAGQSKPKIGFQYTIIKSAWLLGEKVIEYGMVIPGKM